MKELVVTFKSQGEQIVGMLHLPKTTKRCPAVVLLHGFTGSKHEAHRIFVKMARSLAQIGFVVLRFDFRGCGDSAGDFSQMTPLRERADARAALAFLRRRKEIDPKRIGMLGLSLGGMITALILGEDRRISTAVLWNPVGNPRRLVANRMTPEARQQLASMGVIDMLGWPVGRAFIDEMVSLQPLQSIVRTKAPILIIHAGNDQSVPLIEPQDYVRVLEEAGRHVRLQIIPDADHTFNSLPWETEVVGFSLEWFRCMMG